MLRGVIGCSCAAFLLVSTPRVALAEPRPVDHERADALFEAGRRAMSEAHYDVACSDFAESQRIEAALGTLLNWAVCLEAQGKTASAWASYQAVLEHTRASADPDRERMARERLEVLEPVLCHLTILPPNPPPAGLEMKVDGHSVVAGPADGTSRAVDPGAHRIEASAQGYESWSDSISIVTPGSTRVVRVPLLAPVLTPPPDPARTPPRAPAATERGRSEQPSTERWLLAATSGVAVAALLTTAYAGLRANAEWNVRQVHCPAHQCDAEAVAASTRAGNWAVTADVAAVVTVAAVGASLYLWLSPSRRGDGTRARLDVRAARQSMYLGLRSEF
jgi:hypothetical protein